MTSDPLLEEEKRQVCSSYTVNRPSDFLIHDRDPSLVLKQEIIECHNLEKSAQNCGQSSDQEEGK